MDLTKNFVCNLGIIKPGERITYESLVQEDTHEHHDILDSKHWELASKKDKSQEQNSPPKLHTETIYQSVNKALKQLEFKSCNSENGDIPRGGPSAMSYVTYNKYDKKFQTERY